MAPRASAQSICQAETAVIPYWRGDENRCGGMSWAVQVPRERHLHGVSLFEHNETLHTYEDMCEDAIVYCASIASEALISQLEVGKIQLSWD